ncbi:hypothetical protein BVRB_7g160500 isoform A [Beta vulgaris subsp. vulgaris]|nr:hypothetical protein BVRB_7g160500 isoform A [Beta vulgaris subsp. vulgaris]
MRYEIGNLNALDEAHISTSTTCGKEETIFQNMNSLLRPLSNIQHLFLGELSIEVLADGKSKDKLLPLYPI